MYHRRILHIFTYRDQFFTIVERVSANSQLYFLEDALGKERQLADPSSLLDIERACRSILAEHNNTVEREAAGRTAVRRIAEGKTP
jgi:hypothetical protein